VNRAHSVTEFYAFGIVGSLATTRRALGSGTEGSNSACSSGSQERTLRHLSAATVGEVMTSGAMTVSEDTPLSEIVRAKADQSRPGR